MSTFLSMAESNSGGKVDIHLKRSSVMIQRLVAFFILSTMFTLGSMSASASPHPRIFHFERGRSRGWLGVQVENISRRLAEEQQLKNTSGAYVTEVSEDGPAGRAGIKEGDVITKLDG